MLSFYLSLADTPEDKDKIRGIYEKYHDLMMAVAVRFFDDRHDAEDAVHQAFLTIIKNLERISRVDCPETRRFCVIITRSRCLDMLRSRKRDFSVENTDSVVLNSTDPVDDSLLFEAETPLQKALQRVNERYREVLYWRYVDGFKTKDIARMLGIKEDAAQKLIWRAKEAVKKAYEEDNDE